MWHYFMFLKSYSKIEFSVSVTDYFLEDLSGVNVHDNYYVIVLPHC